MKYIVTSGFVQEKNVMVLVPNNWDDYSYKTTFEAKYIEETGLEIDLGTIKVGKDGLDSGWVKEYLEGSFTELSPEFFSLWQSAESYQKVREIEEKYDLNIFKNLNDIAYNLLLLRKYEEQPVVRSSLLRFVSKHMCVNQFHRISMGESILTPYHFDYLVKQKDECFEDIKLEFSVLPNSLPPTNIHAIIGSNGTGKTTLIKNMIKSICNEDKLSGEFVYALSAENELGYFESVICVSFSPFDNYSDVESYKNLK